MDEQELREFMAARTPSPHVGRTSWPEGLACFGCAHSAASEPPPGRPSGERPCCSCVRNPERPWIEREVPPQLVVGDKTVHVGDDGHARNFNPFAGTMYNGTPRLYFPMDNYVTLDQRDQEDWLREHPEYERPIRFDASGKLHAITEDE